MIKFHPDENILLEYVSGALPTALSLSVCAHLQLCTECAKRVKELQMIGGVVLEHSLAEPFQEKSFQELMAKIDAQSADQFAEPDLADHLNHPQTNHAGHLHTSNSHASDLHASHLKDQWWEINDPQLSAIELPKVIRKLMPSNKKLRWSGLGTLKTALLETGQKEFEVAFQKIKSGGKAVHHGHQGIEVTLVLHGSFSDEDGVYSQGDFLVRYPGEEHKPTATQNQDCLCLSVAAAPVAVTGWLGKLVNPLIGFHPQ